MIQASTSFNVSKREFWIFYYKYRQRLWLAFLLPFALFVIVSFLPTARYKAESVMIVRLGSEYVYQPEVGTNQNSPNATIPFDQDEIFKSEVAILGSHDLHSKVVKAIGVETLYPKMLHSGVISQAIGAVENAISSVAVDLNLVDEEEPSAEQKERALIARAVEHFDKRFDILLEKESAVIDISFEHEDPEVATRALDVLLKLYMEKRKQLYIEPRAELAEAQMKATHEHALAAEKAVEDYKRAHHIHSIEDERLSLIEARSDMEKQSTTIISSGLQQKIGYYNSQLSRLDSQEREFNNLEREAKIANDSYALYSHRLDEARAYEDLQRERAGSVRIIQPPSVPPEPKRLQMIIIAAGLLVSLVSLLVVAALTEFMQSGFLTPERVQNNLGLPVLAVYPFHSHAVPE